MNNNFFRWLPAVDEILEMKEIKEDSSLPRPLLVEVIRNVLSEYRDSLRQGTIQYENSHLLKKAVISDIISYIKKNARPVLQPVINATGVVLHTNLGRAVLSEAARCAVDMVASGYSNLEINLETGLRGSRYSHVEELLRKLTGAEDCIVVNNNAAAVLLALDTLAKGKETIVSRGELVEIGGAFRIPEVMERSGSKLVEVGTTNKTYVCDYEKAITDETGLLLKVHTSNYRVIGFTHQVKLHELAQLGQKNKIPVMEDLGSGCFYDLRITGIGDEPTVPQAVHTGADIITFSGDKLLGGPQAGIIVGKEKYISLMKKNPLNRALRIDKMQRIIVGTAGHVDHGKTVLTKKLTGINTDRLKEEKERGISIELGFAPLTLPSGIQVGLVDVPGHERFIKNMLAGIAGIDLVLLVIAADEGIMPQTQEHLDIINLLEVKKGIVVLTKCDLVDDEWLELVKQEVAEVLAGTVLEKAPVVPVSAVTGLGIPDLLSEIDVMAQDTPPKEITGKARIPIDRVFSITGFGTVITGTLWSGRLKVGSTVEIFPQGISVRIRNIQVHGEKVFEATAGQRVAVNIAGVEMEEVQRGDVLSESGLLEPSFRIDVKFRLLEHTGITLQQRARVRIHHGTREVIGRVNFLDREYLAPGETCFCQLVLESPLMVLRGDHYVIRAYSPMLTIGGGIVVDPVPDKHKRYKEKIIKTLEVKSLGEPKELVCQAIAEEGVGLVTVPELARKTGLEESLIKGQAIILSEENETVAIKGDGVVFYLWGQREKQWRSKMKKRIQEYHEKYPLRPGISKEELRSRDFPGIQGKQFNLLLDYWEKIGEIRTNGQSVADSGFMVKISPQLEKAKDIIEQLTKANPFSPPGWDELAEAAGLSGDVKNEMLVWLQQNQVIVKLSDEVVMHYQAIENAKEIIGELLKVHGTMQLSQARDLLNTSRKYALPLLEYLDQVKFTRRKGDIRVLFS